ncbi:MAG: S1 family peptidase [Janthinobacterium lividum]
MITDDNPKLETLRRSWTTAVYTDDDGIGHMGSLHEAGDALVAVALLEDCGTTVLGSGVMIGPGLVIVATHVLDEFARRNAKPVLLTFLPCGSRAWLPRESSTVSGPSAFDPDRRIVSDISLLSCTLNSEAHETYALTLAPMQVSLPLVGERLWAFGYRHEALNDTAALISPLVASGVVTSVFPQGRGERMPSACVEVAMDTKGGMSGGPVVNASGDLVGVVSSSFDGGPSYVTLIWEALRLAISSVHPWLPFKGDINLFAARELGLIKLKGHVKRSKRGNITMMLTQPEGELLLASSDAASIVSHRPDSKPIVGEPLADFEELWLPKIESAAVETAMAHLNKAELSLVRSALAASDVPKACLAPILKFSVGDWEGLEDPDIQSAREESDGNVTVAFAFDLLSVCWTIEVPTNDYLSLEDGYKTHFINIEVDSTTTSMELYQRCHFEAELTLNRQDADVTESSITFSGVVRSKNMRQK